MEAFNSGEDLHTFVASTAFGIPVDQVDPELRRRIKAMSYGLAYGLSAFGLAQQLNISPDEAKLQMETYFNRFGGVRDYLRDVVDVARKDGYTETILGRRRYLPDLVSDNGQRRQMAERMALNAPIQGSAADIIKVAMLGVDRALTRAGGSGRGCCCRCTTSWCSRCGRGSGPRSRRWSASRWATPTSSPCRSPSPSAPAAPGTTPATEPARCDGRSEAVGAHRGVGPLEQRLGGAVLAGPDDRGARPGR